MTDLKSKSDRELAESIAGWKPENMVEFDRRKNRGNMVRGWIAIGISLLALVISVVALGN